MSTRKYFQFGWELLGCLIDVGRHPDLGSGGSTLRACTTPEAGGGLGIHTHAHTPGVHTCKNARQQCMWQPKCHLGCNEALSLVQCIWKLQLYCLRKSICPGGLKIRLNLHSSLNPINPNLDIVVAGVATNQCQQRQKCYAKLKEVPAERLQSAGAFAFDSGGEYMTTSGLACMAQLRQRLVELKSTTPSRGRSSSHQKVQACQ